MDTLANMERVETDKKDQPKEVITIEDAVIFVNPFDEVDEEVICRPVISQDFFYKSPFASTFS